MKKLLVVWTLLLIVVLLPGIAFPQAQYLIDGVNPFALTLETLPPHNCQTVAITLDPDGEITTPLITAGCWVVYDPAQVSIGDVGTYPVLWDPGTSGFILEPLGPGTFMFTGSSFVPLRIDLGPVPLCDVEFCCEGLGQSQITISPVPGFDTVVGGTTVWDPYIDQGIINLTQVIPQTDSDDDGILDYEDNCLFEHNTNQVDTYPPGGNGIGDACDCESDFDCDGDVDGTDKANFKMNFGRSLFEQPCSNESPCNGDFDCDNDCDGTDVTKLKEDFGRSVYNNPCPSCAQGEWCSY